MEKHLVFSKQRSAFPNVILKRCATVFNTLCLPLYTNLTDNKHISGISSLCTTLCFRRYQISSSACLVPVSVLPVTAGMCPPVSTVWSPSAASVAQTSHQPQQLQPPHHIQHSWVAAPNTATATTTTVTAVSRLCVAQLITEFAAINWLSPARKQKQRSGANDGHSHTQICPH